jgi:L-alanine-DL-glutamate epimerase-like enolase superfamily enzyme
MVHWQATAKHQAGVAVIHTDEGVDGVVAMRARDLKDIVSLWPAARDALEGQDVLDRARLDDLVRTRFAWPTRARAILDYGLWDLTGKAFDQPVYKLLGATRERVLAYGSTVHHDTDEKFVETALACKELGLKAVKIHPYNVAEMDIPLCRKVRKAVGSDMILMLDTLQYPGPYTRAEAMRVGRVLDELDFYWFEDPLDKRDLEGLAELTRTLNVQIRSGDKVEDIREYGYMVRNRCMDILAGPAAMGISDQLKLAHLAEINFLQYEPHDYHGGTPSLHVLLSITNGRFYEKAVPVGRWYESSYPGVYLDPVQFESDGYVYAPKKPGLGFEIDWNEAAKVTEQTINV